MVLIKQDISDKIQKAEYIEGTQTASTSAWTGVSETISILKKGQVIYYKLPYVSTSTSVTLNLTLKNGVTTGAKNVFYNNTSRLTTQYGVGSVIGLVYTGTEWRVIDPYTNTTYSTATTTNNGLMSSGDKTNLDKLLSSTDTTKNAHTHGNITSDGKIGSASGNVITTTTNGLLQASTTIGTSQIANSSINNDKIADYTIEEKKMKVYMGNGGSNTSGYVKILQFQLTNNYIDRPLTFDISQRHIKDARHFTIMFKSSNDTTYPNFDFPVEDITYYGTDEYTRGESNVYLYKEGTATWSLLVQKTEAYDNVYIRNLICDNAITITSLNTLVTTLPTSTDEHPLIKAEYHNNPSSNYLPADESNTVNLNNITATGFYYNKQNTECNYITPLPETGKAFFLLVENWTLTPTYCKQTLTHYSSNITYTRVKVSGTWGRWTQLTKNHELIVSNHSSGTNNWTGVSKTIDNLQKGTVVYFNLKQDPTTANATLNLTLENNKGDTTNTGAKTIYFNGVNLTNQYPKNSLIGLVFDGTNWIVISNYKDTTYSTATTSANGLMSSADKSKLDSSRAILNGVTDNASSDEYKVTITGVTLTGGTLISVLNNRGISNNDGASLNVNNLGAKPIYYRNRPIKQGEFPYRSVGLFLYSGSWTAFNEGNGAWILIDEGDVYHKGIVDGGVNILGQHTTSNSSGATGVIERTSALYHGEPVYQLNNTSITDTTKYTDFKWTIGKNEFKYGDIFTLSFYAKGTNGKEIRTYFYGASGYINNRRLRSNSDVGDANIGGYGDGATRFTLTNDWKKYYVTYELNTTATTPTANKYILIRVFGGTDIQLACAKLERGEIATDFTPSTTPINIDYTIDYNDYTSEGHYYIWGGSNASSQVNNTNRPPNDTQGGLLVVEKIPNGVVQKLYNYYLAQPKIYYRIYHYTAGWRDWKELTVEGHTQATTSITNSETYSNLGSSLTNQKLINDAVNTKIGQKLTTAQGTGAKDRFVYTDGSGNIGTKAQVGNLKIDGSIGTASGNIITTTTNGVLQSSSTITKSKISDFSHAHGNITNEGKVTATTSSVSRVLVAESDGTVKSIAKLPSANVTVSNVGSYSNGILNI